MFVPEMLMFPPAVSEAFAVAVALVVAPGAADDDPVITARTLSPPRMVTLVPDMPIEAVAETVLFALTLAVTPTPGWALASPPAIVTLPPAETLMVFA
jgi:hypothetical protein